MSDHANTNQTAHQTARLLLDLADKGMSLDEVNAKVGGKLSEQDLAACAWSFRSAANRRAFARWAGLSSKALLANRT